MEKHRLEYFIFGMYILFALWWDFYYASVILGFALIILPTAIKIKLEIKEMEIERINKEKEIDN